MENRTMNDMGKIIAVVLPVLFASFLHTETADAVNIIPKPVKTKVLKGHFSLSKNICITFARDDESAEKTALYLAEQIKKTDSSAAQSQVCHFKV